MQKKRYESINGLRTLACIGIVMMHMKANNNYQISGFLYENVIPSFTNFVFLFMMISAFGMCCGYFDKVLNNDIDIENFYKRRVEKILPIFAFLVLLDIIVLPSLESLVEGFLDITLLFGLFPNSITVIGVGWFIGVVFAFYLIFPFFCVLIKDKKRAWLFFIVSIALNIILFYQYGIGRENIIHCLCYFMGGGIIYQYKEELEQICCSNRVFTILLIVISIGLYFFVGSNVITNLMVSATLLIFALCDSRFLNNGFTNYFSSVSMEVYLSHMFIFRVLETFHVNVLLGSDYLQYILTCLLTLIGAILFSRIFQIAVKVINNKLHLLI